MKSYFVFLSRNKLYTAITIFGFAISLMFVVLVSLYARNEFTVDDFQQNADRIYRVQYGDQGNCYTPPAMGPDLASQYPEIEAYTCIQESNITTLTPIGEKINVRAIVADSSFFSIFSFPLIEGNPTSVLRTNFDVAISEDLANKLFGSASAAMGKSVRHYHQERDLTVNGVYANIKHSTIIPADVIIRTRGMYNSEATYAFEGYNASNYTLMIMGKKGADLEAKAKDFTRYLRDDRKFWVLADKFSDTITIEKFSNVYFSQAHSTGTQGGDKRFVLILIAAALAILLFAVINYINLSVAQSGFRAKEMATRRLMGSTAAVIFGKFILESVMLCTVSFFIALGLASLCQGFFNDMLQSTLNINTEFSAINIALAVSFIGLLGIISGLVPATVITKFSPIEVVRGTFTYRTKKIYSKILITFQYIITVVLIGMTTLIVQQTTFMRHMDIGFQTKNLYAINTGVEKERTESLRSRLMQISGVEAVGFADGQPLTWGNNNSFVAGNAQQSFTIYYMDSVAFKLFGFEVLSSTGNTGDTAFYINQTGLKNLGETEVPDIVIPDNSSHENGYPIRGEVKDFNFRNLTDPISSAMIQNTLRWQANQVIIKSSDPMIVDRLKPVIDEFTNGLPFSGGWLDDDLANWTAKIERQGNLIGSLALLAIVISALGMLAMATYFIRQRSMEVAVRKVFGATRSEVLSMLMWQFLKLVAIAFVLGTPLIWYFGTAWLEGFPYRVQLGALVFLCAAFVAFMVASITVFYQAYRAMNAPTVTALKK